MENTRARQFPPDVIRLIAEKLNDSNLTAKGDVANLAATCRHFRRALSWHVECHRVLFPSIVIGAEDENLRKHFWKRQRQRQWEKMVADTVLSRFKLLPGVANGDCFSTYEHVGEHDGVKYVGLLCLCAHAHPEWLFFPHLRRQIPFPIPSRIHDPKLRACRNKALDETKLMRETVRNLRIKFNK
jgi:hypothetical protein